MAGLWLAGACVTPTTAGTAIPRVSTSLVALADMDPVPTGLGPLVFAGGLALTSNDPRFGGFSGLVVSEGGRRLTAVSDKGWFWRAKLKYLGNELTGVAGGELGRLAGAGGEPLPLGKAAADAEELEQLPGGLLVSFERGRGLWIYPDDDLRAGARPLPLPSFMQDSPANKGVEALARLGDGRILAICEKHGPGDLSLAGLWDGRRWQRLHFLRSDGFLPTSASVLPDGTVLFLERRYTPIEGVAVRISALPAKAIQPGRVLSPKVWALLEPPYTVDNFEGLSVVQRNGQSWLYIISDDNYSPLQRTLLLAFVLQKEN